MSLNFRQPSGKRYFRATGPSARGRATLYPRRGAVLLFLALCFLTTPSLVLAQNTAGVPGPVVNDGHAAVQYRAAWDPDLEFFGQRLHYEQALDGQWMLRGIVQSRETTDSSQDFDFFQIEVFRQLTADGPGWQSGLRFDARVRERGSTGLAGLHWLNQWTPAENWQARFVLLNFVEVGGRARGGVRPQTRANISRRFDGFSIGLESFSSYGKWSDLASFDDQNHQVGPFLTRGLGDNWTLFAGALFGATDASPDQNFRVWFTRRF